MKPLFGAPPLKMNSQKEVQEEKPPIEGQDQYLPLHINNIKPFQWPIVSTQKKKWPIFEQEEKTHVSKTVSQSQAYVRCYSAILKIYSELTKSNAIPNLS